MQGLCSSSNLSSTSHSKRRVGGWVKEGNYASTLLSQFVFIHHSYSVLRDLLILQSIEAANKNSDQCSHKVICNDKFALFAITTKMNA